MLRGESGFQASNARGLFRGSENHPGGLHAGHFTADHPYMSVLDDLEHRAEHAEVWVAEASGAVVAAVTLTFAGQPYSEIARDNELEFRMLAVDPAVQGGGVGRAFVRQVIEHAQSLPAIKAISITSATFMERGPTAFTNPSLQARSRPGLVRAERGCTSLGVPAGAIARQRRLDAEGQPVRHDSDRRYSSGRALSR